MMDGLRINIENRDFNFQNSDDYSEVFLKELLGSRSYLEVSSEELNNIKWFIVDKSTDEYYLITEELTRGQTERILKDMTSFITLEYSEEDEEIKVKSICYEVESLETIFGKYEIVNK